MPSQVSVPQRYVCGRRPGAKFLHPVRQGHRRSGKEWINGFPEIIITPFASIPEYYRNPCSQCHLKLHPAFWGPGRRRRAKRDGGDRFIGPQPRIPQSDVSVFAERPVGNYEGSRQHGLPAVPPESMMALSSHPLQAPDDDRVIQAEWYRLDRIRVRAPPVNRFIDQFRRQYEFEDHSSRLLAPYALSVVDELLNGALYAIQRYQLIFA